MLTVILLSQCEEDNRDPNKNWKAGDDWIDTRDGQLYKTVQIGDQIWMAENLNIGVFVESIERENTAETHSDVHNNGTIEKYCYLNDTAYCETYGGLYDWNEMMNYVTTEGTQGICPDGWHIPTDQEWKDLEIYLGLEGSEADEIGWRGMDQGSMLVHPQIGFNALYAGWRGSNTGKFFSINGRGYFWTSTESLARVIETWNPQIMRDSYFKANGFSVRCVKDSK